jgi:hypothetical protein
MGSCRYCKGTNQTQRRNVCLACTVSSPDDAAVRTTPAPHPGFQRIAFVDSDTGEFQERKLQHREEEEKFYRENA